MIAIFILTAMDQKLRALFAKTSLKVELVHMETNASLHMAPMNFGLTWNIIVRTKQKDAMLLRKKGSAVMAIGAILSTTKHPNAKT